MSSAGPGPPGGSAPGPSDVPARPGGREPGRARRAWRRVLLALFLLCALPGLGWFALRTAPVRERLGAEAARALSARFPAAELTGGVHLDRAFRLVLGPVLVRGSPHAHRPLARVERVTVRPRLRALLRGRLAAAEIVLDGVELDAGPRGERLAELRALLAAARPAASGERSAGEGAGEALPLLRLSRASVAFALSSAPHAPPATSGPWEGTVRASRTKEGTGAVAALEGPAGLRARVEVRPAAAGGLDLVLRLLHLTPAAVPPALRERASAATGLEVLAGELDLSLEAPGVKRLEAGVGRLILSSRKVTVRARRLDVAPVGPISLRVEGELSWDAAARRLALARGRAGPSEESPASVDLALELALRPEPRFSLEVSATALDWSAAMAALPPALRPAHDAPPVHGALAGRVALSGALEHRAAWQLQVELDPDGLRPGQLAPGALDLTRPFSWPAPLPGGGTRQLVVGSQNRDYVPLSALPPTLVRAVLASEDAAFYGHQGFDFDELRKVLERTDGRRLRGASTLTQQLAKNLFLSPDRTLARKVREALTTLALETALGKRRILEIYLNVIEWGPGVRGAGQAARHWFDKDVRELTPREAAFLATVIPNPVRFDFYRRRGALTEAWEARVASVLELLRAGGSLTDEEYDSALGAPLAFRSPAGVRAPEGAAVASPAVSGGGEAEHAADYLSR